MASRLPLPHCAVTVMAEWKVLVPSSLYQRAACLSFQLLLAKISAL